MEMVTQKSRPDDDNDVYVESTVLLQNLTKDCYPVTKLYLEVTDKRGNTIDTSDNCQELPPGGVVSVSSLCSIQAKKLKGAKIELSLEAFKQCAIGFGMCNSIIVEQLVSDASEKLVDGAYLAYLSLSKVSIQFKFSPANGKYDSKRFTEVSIPVSLPVFIKHQLYGHPNYNVVVDYLYGGELIEEYDRELIDRGYEDQTSFLVVKNGNASIVYSVSNAE